MFEGFTRTEIDTSGTTINLVHGRQPGDPVLLLHGYPQNHVMWHKVAPRLAERFSVVVPDLRGYGDSGKPPSDGGLEVYCKRATAQDQVEVMASLGFDSYHVVGHDRGARGRAIAWPSTIPSAYGRSPRWTSYPRRPRSRTWTRDLVLRMVPLAPDAPAVSPSPRP